MPSSHGQLVSDTGEWTAHTPLQAKPPFPAQGEETEQNYWGWLSTMYHTRLSNIGVFTAYPEQGTVLLIRGIWGQVAAWHLAFKYGMFQAQGTHWQS